MTFYFSDLNTIIQANLSKFLMWKSIVVISDEIRRDEVVGKGDRDHEEGDDEKNTSDDDPGGFGYFNLCLLTHIDPKEFGLDEGRPIAK